MAQDTTPLLLACVLLTHFAVRQPVYFVDYSHDSSAR